MGFMQPQNPGPDADAPPLERSHWVAFAGILLMLSGLFDLINGFVAILDHSYYSTTADHGSRELIFNYTAWGWI